MSLIKFNKFMTKLNVATLALSTALGLRFKAAIDQMNVRIPLSILLLFIICPMQILSAIVGFFNPLIGGLHNFPRSSYAKYWPIILFPFWLTQASIHLSLTANNLRQYVLMTADRLAKSARNKRDKKKH